MRTRNVIDKATLHLVVANKTERHGVAQWDVHKTFGQVTDVATLGLLHAEADTTLEAFCTGLVGDDTDGTRLSVCAIGRSLRAGQYFDAVNIINVWVEVLAHCRNRLFIKVYRYRWVSA